MSDSYYALILQAATSMSKPPPKTPELQLHNNSDNSPPSSTQDVTELGLPRDLLTQCFNSSPPHGTNIEYPLTQNTPTSSISEADKTILTKNDCKKRKETSSNDSSTSSLFGSSVFSDENKNENMNEKKKLQKMFFGRSCSINFSHTCPHCNQTICDGTTLTTFIYDRTDINKRTKYKEAKEMFLKTYLLIKDFELFQQTRYSDPDGEYMDANLPMCVRKAFNNYFDSGESSFNQCRRRLKEMSSDDSSNSSSEDSTDSL